jgi:hypothetical protein
VSGLTHEAYCENPSWCQKCERCARCGYRIQAHDGQVDCDTWDDLMAARQPASSAQGADQ